MSFVPRNDAPVLTDQLQLADLARKYDDLLIRVCCRAPRCVHCGDLNVAHLVKDRHAPRSMGELKQRARCTACSCRGQVVLFAAFSSRDR